MTHQLQTYTDLLPHWKVDHHGNLIWKPYRKPAYMIASEDLAREDCIRHMLGKFDNFSEIGEFICAYFKACEIQGIKSLKIQLWGDFTERFEYNNKKIKDYV